MDSVTPSPWDEKGIAAYIDAQWDRPDEIRFRRWVSHDLQPLLVGGTVLDAGCGSGRIYGALVDAGLVAGQNYTGIDGSAAMVDLARRRFPEAEFIQSDILSFHEPADNVLCIQVLQHAPNWRDVLTHLLGLTRGLLYLTTWFGDGGGRKDQATGILEQWLKGDEVMTLCAQHGHVEKGQIQDGTLGSLYVRKK